MVSQKQVATITIYVYPKYDGHFVKFVTLSTAEAIYLVHCLGVPSLFDNCCSYWNKRKVVICFTMFREAEGHTSYQEMDHVRFLDTINKT